MTNRAKHPLDRYVGGEFSAYAYVSGIPTAGSPTSGVGQYVIDTASRLSIADPEAARRMDESGFAKTAPRFADQVKDETRTSTFRTHDEKTATEHEGLVDLHGVLKRIVENPTTSIDEIDGDVRFATARSMLDNVTFIGAPEFKEGVAGIADYWKRYLSRGVGRTVCALAAVSRTNIHKSDRHVLDSVMGHFSNEELKLFGRSVITDIDSLNSNPSSTRVVLLDDWTISGKQLQYGCSKINERGKLDEYAGGIEANVLAASRVRLDNGLGASVKSVAIPVKSYWLAHSSEGFSALARLNDAFISGLHSTVDYDFETLIRQMGKTINEWPMLTQISRDYRERELTNLDRLRVIRESTPNDL